VTGVQTCGSSHLPSSALQIETPKADPSRITKGWTAPKLPEFKPELKVGAMAFGMAAC